MALPRDRELSLMLTSLYLAVSFFLKTNALFTCSIYQTLLVLMNDVTVRVHFFRQILLHQMHPICSYRLGFLRRCSTYSFFLETCLELWRLASFCQGILKKKATSRAPLSLNHCIFLIYSFTANILLETFLNAHYQFEPWHSSDFANNIALCLGIVYVPLCTIPSLLRCSSVTRCLYGPSGVLTHLLVFTRNLDGTFLCQGYSRQLYGGYLLQVPWVRKS